MDGLEAIDCDHDGTALHGHVARPAGGGPHPAVLVMHNAYGLGEQPKTVARRLASLGYVAVAGDMYGGGFDRAAAGARLLPLVEAPERLRGRVAAWHALMAGLSDVDPHRTAAIGYCFGGQCVLELARGGADVRAVVSFHGLLTTSRPARAGAVRAAVTIYTGARDPYAPPEHVAAIETEMRDAGASWQITTFGDARHAFTDPEEADSDRPGLGYDPVADAVSWAGTVALLDGLLTPRARSA